MLPRVAAMFSAVTEAERDAIIAHLEALLALPARRRAAILALTDDHVE